MGPVALLANGYHYDEIRGGPSMAPLTLRALHRVSGDATTVNIHVLSHLSEQRARMLIAEQVTVEDALALADAEVVAALGIGKPGFALAGAAAEASVLGPDTDDNAYLFAVSAVVMQAAYLADPAAADAAVQTLLNQLAEDLAGDGTLDDAALRGRLEAAETALQAEPVRAALADYMAGLGLPGAPPDYARILDQDHDGLANSEDNCPLVANLDQVDADGDERGDACDACPDSGVDMDGDGYDDGCDNCPAVANPDPPQAPSQFDPLSDIDEDGLGNACDFCPNSKDRGADPDDVCCDPRVGGCIEDNGAPEMGCLPKGASFACKEALGGCGPYEQCYCEDLVCMKAGAIRSDPECYHDGCRCDEFRCIAEWCTVGETVCNSATPASRTTARARRRIRRCRISACASTPTPVRASARPRSNVSRGNGETVGHRGRARGRRDRGRGMPRMVGGGPRGRSVGLRRRRGRGGRGVRRRRRARPRRVRGGLLARDDRRGHVRGPLAHLRGVRGGGGALLGLGRGGAARQRRHGDDRGRGDGAAGGRRGGRRGGGAGGVQR
nr:thrombospondin type 3 repeat-containing protein [Nannocystis pusilla]